MTRRAWIAFALLAALWGAPYLLIKIVLDDLSPLAVAALRLGLGALVLAPVAGARHGFAGLRARFGCLVVLATIEMAAPFALISFGERRISSALAGTLVASAPLFVALLALWFDHEERADAQRLAGLGAGILGVALLLGFDLAGPGELLGAAMVLLASFGYAIGALLLKARFADRDPLGTMAAAMAIAAVLLAAPAVVVGGGATLTAGGAAALGALGVASTGIAFGLFGWLNAKVGPGRASVVAYVAPGFAVALGVVFRSERVTIATLGGLALILAGSWLATRDSPPAGESLAGAELERARA